MQTTTNLVLTRLKGESLNIGDDIKITVVDSGRTYVHLAIEAPDETLVEPKGQEEYGATISINHSDRAERLDRGGTRAIETGRADA